MAGRQQNRTPRIHLRPPSWNPCGSKKRTDHAQNPPEIEPNPKQIEGKKRTGTPDLEAESGAARAKSRASDPGRAEGRRMRGFDLEGRTGEKSKAWGEKTGALTNKEIPSLPRYSSLHSAKANPSAPETIKKKRSTSIPIEPKEPPNESKKTKSSSSKNPDQNHAEIRGLGRAISSSISHHHHQPGASRDGWR